MLKAFGKDFLIYGLSSSIGKFVSLLLVPVYTRIFTPQDYGTMDIIYSIVTIVSVFGIVQLESAVSRYYYSEKCERNRNVMVSTAMWTILCLSLIVCLIVCLFSNLISIVLFNSPSYALAIIMACFTIPVSNLCSLFVVVVRFKKEPLHYMFFQLTQIGSTVLLTLGLTVYFNAGIVGVFISQVVGFTLSVVIMGVYLRKELLFVWKVSVFTKMLGYSAPLVPSIAGGWLNSYLNRFIMLGYLSVAEIGIYSVALKIASVFQLISSAFRMAWGPFFWETFEKNPEHKNIFVKIQRHITFLVLFLVMAVALMSEQLINLFATEAYVDASKMIGIIALSMAITGIIMQITGVGPGITKKTGYNTITYLLSVPINIGGLFIFVPLLGGIGVPISLLLGSLIHLIVGWYNSEKLYYIGFDKKSMIVNTFVCLCIITLNVVFDIPFYIRCIIVIGMFIFVIAKYSSFAKPILNRINKNR